MAGLWPKEGGLMNNSRAHHGRTRGIAAALVLLATILVLVACGSDNNSQKAAKQSFKVGILNPIELFDSIRR